MSTKNVKANLADHIAIRDLIARYTDAVNERDENAIASQFTANGVWDMGGAAVGNMAQYITGARNIAQTIAKLTETTSLSVQMTHSSAIEVEGKGATARTLVNEVVALKGGGGMTILGKYTDSLVLEEDGEWRFSKRVWRFAYLDSSGLPGQVMIDKSEPGEKLS